MEDPEKKQNRAVRGETAVEKGQPTQGSGETVEDPG